MMLKISIKQPKQRQKERKMREAIDSRIIVIYY